MRTSTDRILTTHVGSLPRPPTLLGLILAKERRQPYDEGAFAHAVTDAVAATVRRQKEFGIDIVSDGEMGKFGYGTYVKDRLEGFGGDYTSKPSRDMIPYPDLGRRAAAAGTSLPDVSHRVWCIGPVRLKDPAAIRTELADLRAAVDAAGVEEAFVPAASPGVVTSFQMNRYYPNHESYVQAVAEAMREEYRAIIDAGFILQLDCPDLAMSRNTTFQDMDDASFLKQAERHVEALNFALQGIPADRVRLHVCWGNHEGPHDFDLAVETVLPYLRRAKPQAISFEAANPRHEHEWEAWIAAKLPEDKILIPGVIDSVTNYVEHPELVSQRLQRFARGLGRERVIAGVDCGFGTFAGASKVDPGIVEKKLAALAEGARLASKALWP